MKINKTYILSAAVLITPLHILIEETQTFNKFKNESEIQTIIFNYVIIIYLFSVLE